MASSSANLRSASLYCIVCMAWHGCGACQMKTDVPYTRKRTNKRDQRQKSSAVRNVDVGCSKEEKSLRRARWGICVRRWGGIVGRSPHGLRSQNLRSTHYVSIVMGDDACATSGCVLPIYSRSKGEEDGVRVDGLLTYPQDLSCVDGCCVLAFADSRT